MRSSLPTYDRRVRHVTFFSRALAVPRALYIYVPPDLPAGERAPSLYLLRGHEREWVNPQEDASRGGNVIDVYERLRAAGRVGPLVLVFPGMTSADGRVPGLLTNMRAPELAAGASGVGSGRFEDFFFDDLIPFVDAHFPTLADGRRRGVAGFSLGGAMAAKAVARRPDLFASAGAYDGTFLYAADRGRRVRLRDRVLHSPTLDAAFGVPRDIPFVAANSPACMVLRGDRAALRRVTWVIGYGPEELEPWQSNYYRGVSFVACLRARGITNALPEGAFPGGPHTWRTADAFMEATLPIHDAALRR
ncbi:MAG TPA: alpha/beta hydrolase-fold protein [Roseiflexaceae bacterium]|nr:alpha/beta hydrolase-fold protein [Roseiflexaceae bacterium]